MHTRASRVNAISANQLDNDAYTDGACGPTGAKIWLMFGLVMSFSCLIAGIWLMAQEYIEKDQSKTAGVCLMLQNVFIFVR